MKQLVNELNPTLLTDTSLTYRAWQLAGKCWYPTAASHLFDQRWRHSHLTMHPHSMRSEEIQSDLALATEHGGHHPRWLHWHSLHLPTLGPPWQSSLCQQSAYCNIIFETWDHVAGVITLVPAQSSLSTPWARPAPPRGQQQLIWWVAECWRHSHQHLPPVEL
jgi:hypothetical protein